MKGRATLVTWGEHRSQRDDSRGIHNAEYEERQKWFSRSEKSFVTGIIMAVVVGLAAALIVLLVSKVNPRQTAQPERPTEANVTRLSLSPHALSWLEQNKETMEKAIENASTRK